MTTWNPRMRALATGLAIAIAAFAASSAGAEENKEEKPTEQPPPEVVEPVASPVVATDAALRASFKEYVGLRKSEEKAVYLTFAKGANLDAAANLAREVWVKTAGEGRDLPHFEFVPAAANAEELKGAFEMLRDVLTLKDVVFLDLDEACGCISIGVATKEPSPEIASFIKQRGVNSRWVKTVVTPVVRQTQMLTSRIRPTMGGLQIRNWTSICTLGLPTYSWRMQAYGILTASHCTEGPLGGSQPTDIAQGLFLFDNIAHETLDRPLFNNAADANCPVGRMCRYSDAAFANYNHPTFGITGRVTRPASVCVAAGPACSVSVTRNTDDIRMLWGISGLFVGINVDKVGRTSGWTRGPITRTCTDFNVSGTDAMGAIFDTGVTMLCQTEAAATSMPGDSGGPVFEFHPTVGGGSFAGILWGGAFDSTTFVFSPIDGIQRDLGTFVYNQEGVSGTWYSNGQFYTSNVDDELSVIIERNVVPADQVEFVLQAGTQVFDRKEIVLVENPAAGTGRWTIAVDRNRRSDANGLYLYQLPGGLLEFRKLLNGSMSEVSRVPIDNISGGTRLTFQWGSD